MDSASTDTENAPLQALLTHLDSATLLAQPLQIDDAFRGALLIYQKTISETDSLHQTALSDTLAQIAPALAAILHHHSKTQTLNKHLTTLERETDIFRQIDTELTRLTELDYIFTMTIDWALRFTGADAAALMLYDRTRDTLRMAAQYGYPPATLTNDEELLPEKAGISYRVAHSGQSEVVPNAELDKDYSMIDSRLRSQLTVPVMREKRVIAVLALESYTLNGFNDEHLDFAHKLTRRAGIAVDNARLFSETRREREKLSFLLSHIADVVLVVGMDGRIMLINYSAMLALHLSVDDDYTGRRFSDIISHTELEMLYRNVLESGEGGSAEFELPNGRTYYATVDSYQDIGHIIVMRDVTHYKEADKVKTEFLATVSHDLKQPLSTMRGYLDLLQMTNTFDARSMRYIDNVNRSFNNMHRLIGDLLDIARIESGLDIDEEPVDLHQVLNEAQKLVIGDARQKSQTFEMTLPDTLPPLFGDSFRLQQVFVNLFSNAIKYTPPEGRVHVRVDVIADRVQVRVQDNGLGISPEGISQIFERFYRVRRPETDSIEGTGLGLAIVRSLVEAHSGKISVSSELGEGSTFRVSFPVVPEAIAQA